MHRPRARYVAFCVSLAACGSSTPASRDATVPRTDATAMVPDADASIALPGRVCTIAPPQPSDWRLHADGTLLRDGLGRVVFLRGVDAGGRSKFAPYVPFDYATGGFDAALTTYMDRAASWGIDAMRVPFTWAALEPTQGTYNTAWLAQYQQILDAAWARGIWTVVDFHQDVYSENFCGDGFPAWTIPAASNPTRNCPGWGTEYITDTDVQQAFDRFWASGSPVQIGYTAAWDTMLAHLANEPGIVGFEPINEPGWGSQDEHTFEATTLTDFYSSIVPHMRSLAPSSLMFVDPTGFSGFAVSTTLRQPMGDGIVFAPHYYPIVPPNIDGATSGLMTWATIGAMWNVPVFVGEFGANNTASTTLPAMTAIFSALDTLGLSGTEWEYSVSTDSWNSEAFSVVGADGTELPVAQALIRPFARAVAGSSIQQSWDGAAFTLNYQPASGVTEVQLPARAFGTSYRVTLAGGCYDVTSSPGRMLIQADPNASVVTLDVGPAP